MRTHTSVSKHAAAALTLCAAFIGAGSLTTTPASAQTPFGVLGVHGSYAQVRDANDGNFLGGVHGELRPIPWLGLNASVDFRSDEQFDVQSGATTASLNVRTVPIQVSGKLYLPLAPQFAPYGMAGAGWYHQVFDFSNDLEALGIRDHDETTFGWHVGLGANLNLAPRFGVYADARWIFLDPERSVDTQTTDQIRDFDFNSMNVQAGVNFLF